jgi:hypothetical protein
MQRAERIGWHHHLWPQPAAFGCKADTRAHVAISDYDATDLKWT